MRHSSLVIALMVGLVFATSAARAAPTCALDENVEVSEGFDTAADLAKQSDSQLTTFVDAFVDGVSLAPLLDAPSSCTAKAYACLIGKTEDQLVAALRKYLVSHPDEASDGANLVAYRALFGACMFSGQPA